MRALAKLVTVNNPDKVLFVGEALVGNEAVDQLSKFDRALRDFSGAGVNKGRGIDGMLVTKWDTVDDKAGFLLFVAHLTDADEGPLALAGWRGVVHDLCDRAANRVCRYRTGTPAFSFPLASRVLTNDYKTYTDLRQLRVANVVEAILSD